MPRPLTFLICDGLADPEGLDAAGGGAEHALVVRLATTEPRFNEQVGIFHALLKLKGLGN